MATGGWSGLWNRVGGEQHNLLIPKGHTTARKIAAILRSSIGNIQSAERVFTNLNEDVKQVVASASPGNPVMNGGAVSIAVNNLTPVPAASFISYVEKATAPASYPVDRSGNGGGGKLGVRI